MIVDKVKKKFTEGLSEKSRTQDFSARTAQRRKIFLGTTPPRPKRTQERNSSKLSVKSKGC